MLFNEPKLLKCIAGRKYETRIACFSALQRAEIAEIDRTYALIVRGFCFSALQRAEIAEILRKRTASARRISVSVLFNEPKLLKLARAPTAMHARSSFSALQRAEIAETAGGGDDGA